MWNKKGRGLTNVSKNINTTICYFYQQLSALLFDYVFKAEEEISQVLKCSHSVVNTAMQHLKKYQQ